jgi:hypothetical protein
MQYLDGLPGGEPALLTTLHGVPLIVSVGMVSKRPVLRINEVTDQLMEYTEAYDEKQAKLAKDASRKQRKADKEARKQSMNADMAAAMPQDPNTQMAAAMAEMQKKMANDPNMTPAMRAQIAAIMAQVSQSSGRQNARPPGSPPAQTSNSDSVPSPGNTLTLDRNMQGFLQFDHEDGSAMTVLIFNRLTDAELIKKDYPDGIIYEYVDFSRFKLPLQNIGVIYQEVNGKILKDLTPVVVH